MRERARVDRVRLHPRRRDRLRSQRVREVQLVALLLEQVGEPLPAVGRLERDLQLATEFGQDRFQCLRVVRDSAREQLPALLVESGDLRALAMEIDADVDHLLEPPFGRRRPRHIAWGAGALGGPLLHGIKWCASSGRHPRLTFTPAASIAITSSGSWLGSASAFAIDSALM